MRWKVGDVLIEKHNPNGGAPRAVIVVEPPEYWMKEEYRYTAAELMTERCWGLYLESNGQWGGPWHSSHDSKIQHPDPDSVWAAWAKSCAEELIA